MPQKTAAGDPTLNLGQVPRNMFETERHAIRQVFKLPRPTLRQSLLLAAIYAAQAVICAVILSLGYSWENASGLGWAIISAVIVLQPGLEASLAQSVARICANVVGAIVAILIAQTLGDGTWQLLIAIVLIVFICEILHLDMGLRAACVSAIIILTFHESKFVSTAIERSISVMIGSVLAIIVQIAGVRLKQILFGSPRPLLPPSPGIRQNSIDPPG